MNILAIIPARGGSKSIPKKNIKDLAGKPLIAYPIELAKSIALINKIVVSTDSTEIAEIARKYGAETPFIRDGALAKDETPMLPVLHHSIKFLEEHQHYKADYILLLYPTCPFLSRERVLEAIKIMDESGCNSVMSVEEDYGRFWKLDEATNQYFPFYPLNYINRQYYRPLFRENGAIYFSKYAALMSPDKLSGKDTRLIDKDSVELVVMKPGEMVDIDTPNDWNKATEKINERNKEKIQEKNEEKKAAPASENIDNRS